MARRLLVVADTFAITGRGLIVVPEVDAGEARGERLMLELRRPDGGRIEVPAYVQVPFSNPPPAVRRACVTLVGVTKDDVPIGSEVWLPD